MTRIISVLGAISGAGATFVSTNIAAWMSVQGNKTLLVDLSKMGVLGSLYLNELAKDKVYPTVYTWKDFKQPEKSLLTTTYGLTVLFGCTHDAKETNNISSDDVDEIIKYFSNSFELIIFDLGGDVYRSHIKCVLPLTNDLIFVSEPTQRCMDAHPEHARNYIMGLEPVLVVNGVSARAYYHSRDIARFFGIEKYIEIHDDKFIKEAIKKRTLQTLYDKGKACNTLRNLAEDILTNEPVTDNSKDLPNQNVTAEEPEKDSISNNEILSNEENIKNENLEDNNNKLGEKDNKEDRNSLEVDEGAHIELNESTDIGEERTENHVSEKEELESVEENIPPKVKDNNKKFFNIKDLKIKTPTLPKIEFSQIQLKRGNNSQEVRYIPHHIITVWSPAGGIIKNLTSLNLAVTAVKQGFDVALINFDLTNPVLDKWFRIPNTSLDKADVNGAGVMTFGPDLNPDLAGKMITEYGWGVKYLPAGNKLGNLGTPDIPVDVLEQVIQNIYRRPVKDKPALTIIDTCCVYEMPVTFAALKNTSILLIPELDSKQEREVINDQLTELERLNIKVNSFEVIWSSAQTSVTVDKARILIPYNNDILTKSSNQRKPYCLVVEENPFVAVLERILSSK